MVGECMDAEVLSLVKLILFVVMVLGVAGLFLVSTSSSEQCRMDALNAMCSTYGNATGGAVQVLSSEKGFWVQCQDGLGAGVKWNMSQ